MIQESQNKTCLACRKPMKGRTDKKFCDDSCRNFYHNQLKSPSNNYIRNINHALGKNRRILESLFPENEGTTSANKEKLLRLGFQFKYITNTYTNKKGNTYFFCYEYGYLPLENDRFLLVKRKQDI
jgi:hypothetical protein